MESRSVIARDRDGRRHDYKGVAEEVLYSDGIVLNLDCRCLYKSTYMIK